MPATRVTSTKMSGWDGMEDFPPDFVGAFFVEADWAADCPATGKAIVKARTARIWAVRKFMVGGRAPSPSRRLRVAPFSVPRSVPFPGELRRACLIFPVRAPVGSAGLGPLDSTLSPFAV